MLFSESNHKPAKETKRARDSLQERTHMLHCKKVRLLENGVSFGTIEKAELIAVSLSP